MTTTSPIPAPPSRAGQHILLVEDDETFARAAAAAIRAAGYRCSIAHDGEQALTIFQATPTDLVVTDISLPGRSGIELLREVRALSPGTPVLVITGYPDFETAVDALRLGVVDYLSKPVMLPDLVAAIGAALERSVSLAQVMAMREALREWDAWLSQVESSLLQSAPDSPPRLPPGPLTPPGARRSALDGLLAEELALLSLREREVVELLASGRRPRDIADVLKISAHTVRNHLKAIFRKLDVHSQVELIGRLRR